MRYILRIFSCVLLIAVPVRGSDEGASRSGDSSGPPPASESEAAEPAKWYDRLTLEGDLRLRYEGFDWGQEFDDGRRDRFRYRFRVGLRSQVLDDLAVGLQLRSGNPDNPISDNQSLDGSFGKNPISIAQAYLRWRALEPLTVVAGKFSPRGLWSVSDLEWDDDVTTEGAMELLSWSFDRGLEKLGLNLYQFVLNESGSGGESYLVGGQIVPVIALGKTNEVALGAGFEAVSRPESVAKLYFDGERVIDASYVTNLIDPESGKMVSDFRVGSLFLDWKNKSIAGWPVRVSVYFYRNFGAGEGLGALLPTGGGPALATGRGTDHDGAWFGRVQVGDYKKPGQVALRFSRYDSHPDALFFAYGQSDTRRSSNVDGYRFDLRIGMPGGSHFNATFYRTEWTLGEDAPMRRWQLDYVVDF